MQDPGFLTRFWLAFAVFFRVLFDAAFAGRALRLRSGNLPTGSGAQASAVPAPTPATLSASAPKLREAPAEAALQLLGLLQREGRLMDFLQEDMSGYTDEQVGAAARVVHDQCKRALDSHLTLERIRSEEEGSRVSVQSGFSPAEIRLLGNVSGEPPFTGALTHAGWRVAHIELPKLSDGHDVHVIAPAEVEL
jgi:hypothetical protein